MTTHFDSHLEISANKLNQGGRNAENETVQNSTASLRVDPNAESYCLQRPHGWLDRPWYQALSIMPTALKTQLIELGTSLDINRPLPCLSLLNELLVKQADQLNLPLFTLIPQPELTVPYEAWIAQHKTIPTRSNWHDVFNAMIWLTFPHTKRILNRIQASEIEAHGVMRTRVRDAATLFDENAAILLCQDPKWFNALQQRQWIEVLWHQREDFLCETRLIVFGHALLEKLQNPYKAITAHVFCLVVQENLSNYFDWSLGWVNQQANDITDNQLAEKISLSFKNNEFLSSVFTPLPVFGIPDWGLSTSWIQNLAFYENTQVFRKAR